MSGAGAGGGCKVTRAEEVLKSPHDKKLYRYLCLDNGLTVLLIRDPEINKEAPPEEGDDEPMEEKGPEDLMEEDGAGRGASNGQGKRPRVGADAKRGTASKKAHASEEEDEGEEEEDDEGESGEDSEDEGEEEEDEGEEESGEEDGEEGGKGNGKKHEAQKKAAAAMCVGVGSFSDPLHMQGLSHYLEHMLFMGSTKYPSENEYDDYISKNGGSTNAYTELEHTNYHFEVSPGALRGALDRFAQFFLSPLCLEGSLEREVLAVDSEFAGVVQEDGCRVAQLICHTAEPEHIYCSFSWGNKQSLWDQPKAAGIDVRAEIFQHYNRHYGAERMSLVLLGGESLDELQGWVQGVFAALPVGKGPRPSFKTAGMPFKGRHLYCMPAVKDHHEVTLTFPLPSLYEQYGKKAEHYISHLVGHEGPGSLLSALKAEGWATEVCAGIDTDGHNCNTACQLFTINLTLTEAGLAATPGLGLAPVALAFQYLDMLAKAGPQEWVWQELRSISEMKFLFHEEEDAMDLVTRLAAGLHLCEPRHALCMDTVHVEWDPNLVAELMAAMKADGRYRIDLLTKSFEQVRPQVEALASASGLTVRPLREPWFQLEAVALELPESLTQSWATQSPDPRMHLPPPNPYIPTDFSLRAGEGDAAAAAAEAERLAASLGLPVVLTVPPTLIMDRPGLRLWHKLDSTFQMPRGCAFFRLYSPCVDGTARASAAGHLLIKLVEDVLNEDAYAADVAGLHYSLHLEGLAGFEVKVDGFSHKLPLLSARVFKALAAAAGGFAEPAFVREKEALVRKYKNSNMQVPKHASYNRLLALCAGVPHVDAVLAELQALMPGDVAAFATQLLASCHLEGLVHGNLDRDEALALAGAAVAALGTGCAADAAARRRARCVQLPAGTAAPAAPAPAAAPTRASARSKKQQQEQQQQQSPASCSVETVFREMAKNPEEENAAVECYLQCCTAASYSDRAAVDLLHQILHEPTYNQLRTKEQLGYTVYSGMRLTHGVLGFCFGVVSAKFPSEHLESRIETFVASASSPSGPLSPACLSQADFDKHRAALQSHRLQKDRSLHDESVRHWDHVWNQRYEFLTRERELKALDEATLGGVLAWFGEHLALGAPGRRKLVVHVQPTKACAAASPEPQAVAQPVLVEPAKADAGAGGKATKGVMSAKGKQQQQQQQQQQQRGGKGKGKAGTGGGEVKAQAKRVLVTDLLAWRAEQEVYAVQVGPEPAALEPSPA